MKNWLPPRIENLNDLTSREIYCLVSVKNRYGKLEAYHTHGHFDDYTFLMRGLVVTDTGVWIKYDHEYENDAVALATTNVSFFPMHCIYEIITSDVIPNNNNEKRTP